MSNGSKGPINWGGLVALMIFACLCGGGKAARAAPDQDVSHIVGPGACVECHKEAVAVWQATHHATSFEARPRSPEAEKIVEKMGMRRMNQKQSSCADCHFTRQQKNDQTRYVAGVSCESCHQPAKRWNKAHADYRGKKPEEETEEDRKRRWRKAERGGMLRPHMTYQLARNCYECHLGHDEDLVNTGGHTPGSAFELLSWSQGEIRHNIAEPKSTENREATPARRRLLYAVGRAVDLEVALRRVAEARTKGPFAIAMAKRAQAAAKDVAKLAATLDIPELKAMMEAMQGVKLRLGNGEALVAAADRIAASAQALSDRYDGSTFGAIEGLLPDEKAYKGKPTR